MQQVDNFYNGHNYCWYYDGWQGLAGIGAGRLGAAVMVGAARFGAGTAGRGVVRGITAVLVTDTTGVGRAATTIAKRSQGILAAVL
jgi:hypothetical protein